MSTPTKNMTNGYNKLHSSINETPTSPSRNSLNKDVSTNEWNFGPDKLFPAESFYSTKLDQAVKLRQTCQEYQPISVYTMFYKTVVRSPNHAALAFKESNQWHYIKYSDYWNLCLKAASSFIKLGLDLNSCVSIIGFNSPQWFISLLGTIFAGGVGCGIYTTNSAEACEYILKDSKSQIVVVENKQQLDKVLKCMNNLNTIKAIVQYSGVVENNHKGLVMNWNEFLNYGDDMPDVYLKNRVKTIAPNKCASLIYTSGTTGNPKAAMISHDSITFLVKHIGGNYINLGYTKERVISYLPLSHIAAQMIDLFAPINFGGTVYFAQPDALKGSLLSTLQEVKPTLFFGVPRVWEKIQEKMEIILRNLSGTKLKLFEWARALAYDHMLSVFNGNEKFNPQYRLAKMLVLNKIYKQLGLEQCRATYSGAAPITKETLDFFISMGIPLCEVYGMSESTGPHCVGVFHCNRVASVGITDKLNQTKIEKKDDDGAGELCMYGRHVFMGYLNDEIKTMEAFDCDGWLHTGDIAKIDSDGFIYITGRLKELIITAGGENIAPIPIEDNIKSELSRLISNCMLVGDKRKYLVVLVTLKSKVDLDTLEPLDDLTEDCIQFLKSIGSKSTRVSDIINNNDPLVYKEIENGIKRANDKSVSRASKVQKFSLLERDFSLPTGELGPTLKLRRPIVHKMYANVIETLYADKSGSNE